MTWSHVFAAGLALVCSGVLGLAGAYVSLATALRAMQRYRA
jgi:hypothetical protein